MSARPAAGLTRVAQNAPMSLASSVWFINATADSISTATNSSSCCRSPYTITHAQTKQIQHRSKTGRNKLTKYHVSVLAKIHILIKVAFHILEYKEKKSLGRAVR